MEHIRTQAAAFWVGKLWKDRRPARCALKESCAEFEASIYKDQHVVRINQYSVDNSSIFRHGRSTLAGWPRIDAHLVGSVAMAHTHVCGPKKERYRLLSD